MIDDESQTVPTNSNSDDSSGGQTQLITIRQPVAIIRPEFVQPKSSSASGVEPPALPDDNSSASESSSGRQFNNDNQPDQPNAQIDAANGQQGQVDRQVIRFHVVPARQHQQQQQQVASAPNSNGKRAPDESSLAANSTQESQTGSYDACKLCLPLSLYSTQPKSFLASSMQWIILLTLSLCKPPTVATKQVAVDQSTAPQNISIMKVAQGWVLEWSAPERVPSISDQQFMERAEAIQDQHQQESGQLNSDNQLLESSTSLPFSGSLNKRQQQQQQQLMANSGASNQEPAAYTIELKEKGTKWHTLATGRDRSLLIKDLRPGGEYTFRVFAHASNGLRGSASQEFRYLIPDNRRKPGSTQALSAGVVSGLLFFIACIVIAVCGVNMCNKRRKKRAEKGKWVESFIDVTVTRLAGKLTARSSALCLHSFHLTAAYVMMACPVLESHTDIAALNSNSLLKK